jgi:type IV pilus assembly protein PilM
MGGTVVGVDIGSNAVRGVEVQGYDTVKPVVVRQFEVPLPETAVRRGEVIEQATVATALRRLWSGGGFKSKEVALGIGGQRVFARDMTVPRAPLPQIRESLPFHVQELLPVPVADVLLDFYPLAEENGESGPMVSGLLVAGLKEAINANVAAVMSAGLRPVRMDLIPFAISRALAPVRSAQGREVIVEIGANTTNVVVVENGIPLFVRMLPNGGDDVTRALATRLQWAPEQAEQAKRALGMGSPMMRPEDRPIIEIVYEVVGELLSGVRNTLAYYANAHPARPVTRVLLTGGASELSGLANALGEVVRLPVAANEPVGVAYARAGKGAVPTTRPSFVTATGLALGSNA